MYKLKHRERWSSVGSQRRRAHVVHVASVDVQGSTDNDQTDLETVPLPRPLSENSSSDAQLSAQYTSLDDLPPVESGERISTSSQGFSLDKSQSLWLLNLVSFVYGTNTTCVSTLKHDTQTHRIAVREQLQGHVQKLCQTQLLRA